QIGSVFYGPVLAMFVLATLAPGVGNAPAVAGLLAGLGGNLLLARLAPGLSWLWWNPAGFLLAMGVALALSRSWLRWPKVNWPRREALLLVGAFLVILALLVNF
ncbi:MAG: hypothetical protein Q8O00_02680, partial [Holophaga sp.]|nr:hypothetical protein [Holophaga sp.]